MYIIVFFIIGTFIGISQSAGIGGGPILNICLMIGLGFTARESMTITYIFLMGGSLAPMIMNFKKKNLKGYPLMDYNLILMTLPMIMSGSIYGTVLNSFLSELVITICFTILLTYLSFNSFKRYRQCQNAPILPTKQIKTIYTIDENSTNIHPSLIRIVLKQKNVIQKQKFKLALLVLLYTVIILLLRGGKTYHSLIGIQKCQLGYWMFNLTHIFLSYYISKRAALQIFKIEEEKEQLGYPFDQDQRQNEQKLKNCMIYGFVAGLAGGCLGLGGAIILVPVWLESRIDKDTATSSSGPLIFLSSLSAFFIALLGGSYHIYSVIGYFLLSFGSSLIVRRIVSQITIKFHLKGMVYILIFITMIVSILTLVPFQIIKYIDDPQKFMQFGILC